MATHKTESPKSTIATRIAQVLKSRKYRRENRSVVAVLALAIVLGVAVVLMQRGLAKKYTVRVLDCHYIGNVAHTHNQDCYDDAGNLICPLRERELHVHDESCFDDQGNLICGKDELVEEHVHGDGCFKTIMTDTPPASDESGLVATGTAKGEVESPEQAEEPNPAMNFSHAFVDADDKPVLAVDVNAPAGALPKDATMEAAWVAPYDVSREDVQHAVSTVTAGKVLDLQAVDITFYDGAHNEIEPEKDVTVTFTSDMLANTKEEAKVVHIESDDEAAERGKGATPQAECVNTISKDELGDDQVAFASNQFSKYVIALVSSELNVTATGNLADGSTITIDAPASAGLPQDTAIEAAQFAPGDSEYDTLVDKATEAAGVEKASYAKAYDIKLKVGDEEVQPQDTVRAFISLNDLPKGQAFAVAHYNEATQSAEIVESWVDGGAIVFEATSFSPYIVINVNQDADPDPDAAHGSLNVMTTLLAADGETDIEDYIGDITFSLHGAGTDTDGSDFDYSQPLEIELDREKTTTISNLPVGEYTVDFALTDTDEYNIDVVLDPADGKVEVTEDGRAYIRVSITVGRKPAEPVIGGIIDLKINKAWQTAGGQQMSWPPDAEPLIEVRRMKSTNEGRSWSYDGTFEDSVYLNHTGTTTLFGLYVEDPDEPGVLYKYYIYETQIGNGYKASINLSGHEIASYTKNDPIPEEALQNAAVYRNATFEIMNTYTGEGDNIDLTLHKEWVDNSGAAVTPPSGAQYEYKLYRVVSTDGGLTYDEDEDYDGPTIAASSADTDDKVFSDLPVMSSDGTELYKYYAKESTIPNGWMPLYVGKSGSNVSVLALGELASTNQSWTQTIKNQKVQSVDVPVEKEWPDFDPSVHSGATWSASFQLERAEIPDGGTIGDFAVVETTPRTLQNGGTLVYSDLPMYRYDENGNRFRYVYSVKEVGYQASRPASGEDPAKNISWDGTGTPEYYTLFIQDAGDPEVDISYDTERWYRIILANIESNLEEPSQYTTIDLNKTWNTTARPDNAEFELIRYVTESYRDWSQVSDADMNNQSAWKPASLTFNGKTSTTIDMPDNAPVYVVVKYSDNAGGAQSRVTVTYTDLNGQTQTVNIERGPGQNGDEIGSVPIYPAAGSNGIRELTVSGAGTNHASGIYVTDASHATNTPVQDAVVSILEMTSSNATGSDPNHWSGKFYNHLAPTDADGNFTDQFPMSQAEPMSGRHQTVYNYSYYVRETASMPLSTPTMTVDGSVHDRTHRIDASNGTAATVEVANRDRAKFSVVKDWADVINPDDRYPAVFFTLYQKQRGSDRGVIFTDPNFDENAFKDIKLSSENHFRWECPIELPRYNDRGQEVEYYVIEKTKDGNSNNNQAGTKAYTEPTFSDKYTPEVKLYYAYSGFENQTTYANYTNSGNPTQPANASVHATEMPGSGGVIAIGGELAIRNNPPQSDQMDMLKKKWFDWKENPGGAAPSLDAGEHMNLKDCIVEYIIVRRALDDSHPDYNAALLDPHYQGGALVKDWHQWYITMYQGWDNKQGEDAAHGRPYSTDVSEDFNEWKKTGNLWHWTLNKNNQYGGGLEYRGYENVNGQVKGVAYEYVFIETGLWRYTETENPQTHEMYPDFHVPYRSDYEYYAILPDAWSADGQRPLFPRIVAQDQDRITNLVGSNLLVDKVWGSSDDLRDVKEVYLKLYYKGQNGGAVDFTNQAAQEPTTILSDSGVVARDRFKKIGDQYYVRLEKGESSLWFHNIPMGTGPNDLFNYWIEECGYLDTNGQEHMDVSRFSPTYAAWDPSNSSWGPDKTNPQDASIKLGKKGDNRLRVDNTPTKKVKVLKRWQDENGADTTAWKNSVQYSIERQARRYSKIGEGDDARFIQDMWFTNDGGQTWLTREEFNQLSDQSGYEAVGYGANVGGTFTPNAWERLTFNNSDKLQVANSPVLYTVKAAGAGSASYSATTGTPAAADAPTYTNASGSTVTATNWYDVIDGLADSISVDDDGDGIIDHEYKYTYRVSEVTEPDEGCCITYEPTSGSLAGGQATIINAKNSLRVIKRWYDADNNEIEEPWDSNLQVKFKIKAVAQDWVFDAATNTWREDGDPHDAVEITPNALEIKQTNQIVKATRDTSDSTHTTYTYAASDAPSGTQVSGRSKWAMRIDGLETEFRDPSNDHKKTTFSYEIVEEELDGAITTYSPHPAGRDDVGRVTNGHSVEIRNRKNPVEITAEKVFKGLTENDLFETDATDPNVKHVKAPLSDIRLKLENKTTPLPIGVSSGVIFDDTIGALYDGGLLTYEVDANDPTKITLRTTVKPGATFPNYRGTLHLDAIVTGSDYELSETDVENKVPTGYQYSTNGATQSVTKNVDTDGQSGHLTIAIANPYKKIVITAKKEFTGIEIADFIETDDSTTPPTEHVKAPLKDISLKLVNKTDSTIIFEDTIGNLFDGGVLAYAYDASAKKLTLSAEISTDSNYPNYSGTIHKEYLLAGKTYELTEADADTKVPAGYQFRAADATSSDDGTPATSGNDEGKLTLELANPYNEIKIHVEKKFTGLDDIFNGVTNAKIVDDYDNLDAGVKKVLEGVKLSLKNNGTLPSGTDPYVFQNKSLKELIQSGVLTYDGQSVKVAGDITKATTGINVDALVGGCEYELTESGADLATSIPTGYVYIAGESKTSDKKTLDATTAQLSVDCENKYIPTIDIKIYKVEENAAGTGPDTAGTPLEGATFVLEKGEFVTDQTSGETTWSKTGEVTVTETSTKGIFDVTGLEAGTYKLVEHDVPAGHIKYDFDPIFNVVYNTQTKMLELSEVTTDPVTGKDIAKGSEVVVDTASNEVRLYVGNQPGEELPHSGGPGTLPMTLAGIALLASASLYLLKAHLKKGLNLHKIG